jgi:phosphohistidine phosphatase
VCAATEDDAGPARKQAAVSTTTTRALRIGTNTTPGHRVSSLGGVRLILVRHAKAASGEPDALRPLTPEGLDVARSLGAELGGLQPDAVVSSPLLRTRQTATPIAEVAGVELELEPRLSPGATLSDFRAVAEGRGKLVVIVGHQPDLSNAVHALTGADVAFRPGTFAEVEL